MHSFKVGFEELSKFTKNIESIKLMLDAEEVIEG